MSVEADAYSFKCPCCGGTKAERVESIKCISVTDVELRKIKRDHIYDIIEIPPHLPPGLPQLCDTETVYYRCKTCKELIELDGKYFTVIDTKFKSL